MATKKKEWKVGIVVPPDPSQKPSNFVWQRPIGTLLNYSPAPRNGIQIVEPFEFDATLTIEKAYYGNHGISGVVWRNASGAEFNMLNSTFITMASTIGIGPGGVVSGHWGMEKNGPSVGIKPIV